ncbi:cation:proton antiporter [Ornithinimicrobium sufpigmenti]|uniref:cation:proton antiporter n=1 Tax=Ornithinimicrobium sufpigmenti TaxID=2508882 RepID=UPI001036C014|nr:MULTISPECIES: monovalent cation/H(+) antiporter subunit G [unclassified Ornithinimicrobium]
MLVLIGLLCLTGAFFVLVSGIAMFKARDGLSRVNVLSAATGVGMPFLAIGVYLRVLQTDGFLWLDLVKLVIAILGFIIMSSVASNALTRAAYRSGAPIDPHTSPNALADESPDRRP